MLHRIICIAVIAVFLSPLPALATGAIELDGLQHKATVFRDVDGIPHIVAKNIHDMIFLQGFVHASDRFFQMDHQRRLASGTLAELLGPAALESDVQLRTIGLRRAAELSLKAYSPEVKKALKAYADGVNAFLNTKPKLPEYAALELTVFEPWEPVDSVVVAKLLAFGLSFDLEDIDRSIILETYVQAGIKLGFDGQKLFFEDLFRSAPFDPASTVPDAKKQLYPKNKHRYGIKGHGGKSKYSAVDSYAKTLAMMQAYKDKAGKVPFLQRALQPRQSGQGSNEWAVSGKYTRSGRPLIANDPHLALDTPSTFYQMQLVAKWDGIDVIGSSFAGAPYIVVGQNKCISWGATVNPLDVTDVFQEQVVPDAKIPGKLYTLYLGALEPIIPIPVEFRFNVIGDGVPDNLQVASGEGIPPVVLIVPRRNNGPIIELDPKTGFALSLQYTGFSGTRELDTFRLWNDADNLDDFIAGLQFFDVGSQNWAYADKHGNIAYFTSAEMPLREDLQAGFIAGVPPYFIRNGTGGNEWLPFEDPPPDQAVPYKILPFEEMPQIVNPPAGFFVNANNDPIGTTLDNNPFNQLRPGGGIYYLSPGYASGLRAGRIMQLMQESFKDRKVDLEDMQKIQADVVMLDAQVFVPYILQAFYNIVEHDNDDDYDDDYDDDDYDDENGLKSGGRGKYGRIKEAVSRLRKWNFSTPTGIVEGYDASDDNGRLSVPTKKEVKNSIAATIYSVWRSQFIKNTIDATLGDLPKPDNERTMTALRNLLDNFDTNNGVGASGVNFFNVPGVDDPEDRRDILIKKSLADALDLLAGDEFAAAFNYSTDQEDYLWGKLHRIVFDHPLGEPFSIPPANGEFPPPLDGLDGIPTDGGFEVVDASSHPVRLKTGNPVDSFMFGSGPARRYAGELSRNRRYFKAETILPGGVSGVLGSPLYFNLLERWLTNDTYPVRQRFIDLFRALDDIKVYNPKK